MKILYWLWGATWVMLLALAAYCVFRNGSI